MSREDDVRGHRQVASAADGAIQVNAVLSRGVLSGTPRLNSKHVLSTSPPMLTTCRRTTILNMRPTIAHEACKALFAADVFIGSGLSFIGPPTNFDKPSSLIRVRLFITNPLWRVLSQIVHPWWGSQRGRISFSSFLLCAIWVLRFFDDDVDLMRLVGPS